jgi:hypothetical protein
MDAAQTAGHSGPAYNKHFSRRWTGPPSSTSNRANFVGSFSTGTSNRTTNEVQSAQHSQRAVDLNRRAALLGLIALTAAAGWIEAIAETVREVLR